LGGEHESVDEEQHLLAGQKLPDYAALVALRELAKGNLLDIHVMKIDPASSLLQKILFSVVGRLGDAHLVCQ